MSGPTRPVNDVAGGSRDLDANNRPGRHAEPDGGDGRFGALLELQRLVGNRAVTGLVSGAESRGAGRQLLTSTPALVGASRSRRRPERQPHLSVQRHASFEHRLLGDMKPDDLFKLGARKDVGRSQGLAIQTADGGAELVAGVQIQHLLAQELARLRWWQAHEPRMDSIETVGTSLAQHTAAAKQVDPQWQVQMVAIPNNKQGSKPLVVTYGELNTLADFYGSVEELQRADPDKVRNVVQSVRNQSYQQLSAYMKEQRPDVETPKQEFEGSFNITDQVAGEVMQMKQDKKGATDDTEKYGATLARNACHFAPESWHSWEDYHHRALAAAADSHRLRTDGQTAAADKKQNEALLLNGFGDHYLQDSYASGHLINKTQIMQFYVEWLDTHPSTWTPSSEGRMTYARDTTLRTFQGMGYRQPGLTDQGQYDKSQVGRRTIGGQQVSTAHNPQAVENTQELGDDFGWQQRFQMLGLRTPEGVGPGTPAFRLLVWMQQQHGGITGRYNVDFGVSDIADTAAKAVTPALSGMEALRALRTLVLGNVVYQVDEDRTVAGQRMQQGFSSLDKSARFTLRKEWVVSVFGGHEERHNQAVASAQKGDFSQYQRMMEATVYKDYVTFIEDAFLQKSTNALHDYFCVNGLDVATGDNEPLFKIYGDNNMLNAQSSIGVRESAITSNMSRDSVLETARSGVEPAAKSTRRILDRLPAWVTPPKGGAPISLAEWHNRGSLKNFADGVFKNMETAPNVLGGLVGAKPGANVGGSLGKITKDQDVHGGEAF